MKSGWLRLPFLEVAAEVSGDNEKTPQSEFLSSGQFAIVDQGRELIAGYTNNPSRLCSSESPVIVFGDHTRCFKFVDFPFCIGADGVKVLRPRLDTDVKYLWHYLRQISLTDGGYDRHYKYLKRTDVVLPPMGEQRRIAEVLDRADALRAKRRASIELLDALTDSAFLEMFSDSASKGWPQETVADISSDAPGSIRTGPFGSQLLHSEFTDSGIAVLGIDNAVRNEFRWGVPRFISPEKYRALRRYTIRPGDVLITIMGTCGRCAIYPDDGPPAINTKHLCCITLDRSKCLPVFMHAYFLRHPIARAYLAGAAKGAIMHGLNMGIVQRMPVLLPPLAMQKAFVERVAAIDKLKTAYRASLVHLDALFASLQHRAFRGEL